MYYYLKSCQSPHNKPLMPTVNWVIKYKTMKGLRCWRYNCLLFSYTPFFHDFMPPPVDVKHIRAGQMLAFHGCISIGVHVFWCTITVLYIIYNYIYLSYIKINYDIYCCSHVHINEQHMMTAKLWTFHFGTLSTNTKMPKLCSRILNPYMGTWNIYITFAIGIM